MLVVNEPELAEAIARLRGEWAERSGGSLTAEAKSWPDLAEGQQLDADVIVFPSRYLGELCVRDWLRPVRPNVLESENLNVADIFPLVRRDLIRWGGRVMALPLGVDMFTPGDATGRQPAVAFFVQAAPSVVAQERLGVLFDPETMKPRITEPAFVATLERLVGASDDNGSDQTAGEHTMPLLGWGDRLAAVAASSHNAASAFQLLAWLAAPEASSQIARDAGGTMPVRRSLASSPAWHDPKLTADQRADLAKSLSAALNRSTFLMVPRIPGIDQYMAALDDAVEAAVSKDIDAAVALRNAAEQWEKITDTHGREHQRQAYLKHLGIAEP